MALRTSPEVGGMGHSIKRNLPIYFTEYGIQSNPPNPQYGVPLVKQAMWLNQMDYTAYKNKLIRSVSQYELVDDGNDPSVFQTGLEFQDGSPKPSLGASLPRKARAKCRFSASYPYTTASAGTTGINPISAFCFSTRSSPARPCTARETNTRSPESSEFHYIEYSGPSSSAEKSRPEPT